MAISEYTPPMIRPEINSLAHISTVYSCWTPKTKYNRHNINNNTIIPNPWRICFGSLLLLICGVDVSFDCIHHSSRLVVEIKGNTQGKYELSLRLNQQYFY
jgi:hypothetical protein